MENKGFVAEIVNKNNGSREFAIFDSKQEGIDYLDKFLREDYHEYEYMDKNYLLDSLHTDGGIDAHNIYMKVSPSRSLSIEEQKVGHVINDKPANIIAQNAIEEVITTLKNNGVSLPDIGKALNNATKNAMVQLGKEHLNGQSR